jgi:uncharacterized protein (DUF2384 family)
MALVGFDIRNLDLVARALGGANRRLARESVAPRSVVELLDQLCRDIGSTDQSELSGVSSEDWIALQSAALRTQTALHQVDDEREQRRQLRLLMDELRARLFRIADKQPVSDDRPVKDVVRWLDGIVSLPQQRKAALLGASERTYQRWISETETSRPEGEEERRVRLIARAVNDLRFLFTAGGAVEWLERENARLDGRAPLELLGAGDPEQAQRVFDVAASARTGAAA